MAVKTVIRIVTYYLQVSCILVQRVTLFEKYLPSSAVFSLSDCRILFPSFFRVYGNVQSGIRNRNSNRDKLENTESSSAVKYFKIASPLLSAFEILSGHSQTGKLTWKKSSSHRPWLHGSSDWEEPMNIGSWRLIMQTLDYPYHSAQFPWVQII